MHQTPSSDKADICERTLETQLDTAHQARTAAITMIPHAYGISGVSAGMNAVREGIIWKVPVVFQPPHAGRIKTAEQLLQEFENAQTVGTILLSAVNADLITLTTRDEVRKAVEEILKKPVKPAPPGLSSSINHHEIAWRRALWVFGECDMPPQLVAGKASLDASGERWNLPVSIYDEESGKKIWNSEIQISCESGHIFNLPDPALLKKILGQDAQ